MQIFIGRIPRDIRYDELYDYFNRFGKIRELRLLDSYGFVTFVYDMDARRVLDEKHFLFGKEICVEPSRDSRPGSSYSVNRFERDYPRGFDRGYRSPPSYDRGYCDYCDRCEIHGTRRYRSDFRRGDDKRVKLGDFNGVKTKLVIDNLSPATNKQDLIDFLISKGFEPIYTRITEVGNHGIVEFRSVEEKEDALLKLNNLEFLGNKITVRPYFSRESRGNFENESRSYSRKSEESKEYNNNYSENVNKEDIYGDINLNCEDKMEEKNVEEKVENSELNK